MGSSPITRSFISMRYDRSYLHQQGSSFDSVSHKSKTGEILGGEGYVQYERPENWQDHCNNTLCTAQIVMVVTRGAKPGMLKSAIKTNWKG